MVFSDVHRLGQALGARSDTFLGIAGAGDLVGTALAHKSSNRRAGELIGRGVPAKQAAGTLNGSAESLDTVPLLADALARAGIESPGTSGLRDVLAGELGVDEWLERLRSAGRKPQGGPG
jgi:glycerol-3-phosphate dehydrogenase (NAD(P)+)